MGIFSTPEELREEGKAFFEQNNYERAIISYEKAISKGDSESIVLWFEAKYRYGALREAEERLVKYLNDQDIPKVSDDVKIDICKVLIKYKSLNLEEYFEIAANLGDLDSIRHMFYRMKAREDYEKTAYWLDKIMAHKKADKFLKYESVDEFERIYPTNEELFQKGSGIYCLRNWRIGNYTRSDLLKYLIECPVDVGTRKGEAYYELGRMGLVEKYEINRDNGRYNKVETYRLNDNIIPGTFDRFSKAAELRYKPAYFYLAIMSFFGLDHDRNILLSKKYMDKLLEKGMESAYDRQLAKTVNDWDISALDFHILSKLKVENCVEELNTIIGHTRVKDKILREISTIEKYEKWDGNSNFSKFQKKHIMSHRIIVLRGRESNCKKKVTQIYQKIIPHLYKLHTEYENVYYRDIEAIEINSLGGFENKISYIKQKISVGNKETVFAYFDQPYNISDPQGENYYHVIMQNLVREFLKSTDRILFLAGDGDLIIDELKALNIPDYTYVDDIIDFDGYNEDEGVELLKYLGSSHQMSCVNVYEHLRQMIKMRNLQYSSNINYDEIQSMFHILERRYFELGETYRNCVENYHDAFRVIEKRIGIEEVSEQTIEEALAELDELVGLDNLKKEVQNIVSTVKINNIRRNRGMVPMFTSMHMIFSGNPGTGKTSVARLMAKILKALGVLEKEHLVEKSRADLVSQYWGATAGKTKEILKSALNGVLFIDEAYSLTNGMGSSKDYGMEAIEEILKFMSDKEGQLVVIAAGYEDKMEEFLNSNPGLNSRFNVKIHFDDYTEEELLEIFKRSCEKNGFYIEEGSDSYIIDHFEMVKNVQKKDFGNARYVNQYFSCITQLRSRELSLIDETGTELTDDMLCRLPRKLFEEYQLQYKRDNAKKLGIDI